LLSGLLKGGDRTDGIHNGTGIIKGKLEEHFPVEVSSFEDLEAAQAPTHVSIVDVYRK
jgi:hypothetical protein